MNARIVVVAALLGSGLAVGTVARAQTSADAPLVANGATLPAAPERTAVQANCQICHSLDMVTSQRLSTAVWTSEVAKMVKWGSPLPADQQPAVVAYLAKYLAPTTPRKLDQPLKAAPAITLDKPPAP